MTSTMKRAHERLKTVGCRGEAVTFYVNGMNFGKLLVRNCSKITSRFSDPYPLPQGAMVSTHLQPLPPQRGGEEIKCPKEGENV